MFVGRQEEHPACKKLSVGVVICLERGADRLHMVQLMPLHPKSLSYLASFKSRLGLPFGYLLFQVVMEKRLLNRCSSSICYPHSRTLKMVLTNCEIQFLLMHWLFWHQENIWPVKNEWQGAGMVISLEQSAYDSAYGTATASFLASLKFSMVYISSASVT